MKKQLTTDRLHQVITAIETGRRRGRQGCHAWAEFELLGWERGTEIVELRGGCNVVKGIWIGISGTGSGLKWVVWDHGDTVKETRRKVRSYSKQCDESTPWKPTFSLDRNRL